MFPEGVGADITIELAPAQRAQVVIGTLLVALTAVLAGALFGPREAGGRGGDGRPVSDIRGLPPPFVVGCLLRGAADWALVSVVRGQRRPGYPLAALTGLVFGMSALTREVGLVLAAVCAGWWRHTAALPDRRAAAARGR